ncbi:TetR/AcrR family transcriptional regulator [Ferdinandcohnia quinoae]|uniref:TetR/AcrR family transcriptional regulator n=1 Tax=Fredinandcohnia quinoae TaxID=2918902 RepID=A0AAW5DX54_9BACI|nr:TetR/AcrR family transcriptional regulator [Fredinandcohnia sp. SECRCQ15]MCH1624628.1 TetR/AcrR family transcriptional regulator [Fredinandcohnia sp. SECRCQ15]
MKKKILKRRNMITAAKRLFTEYGFENTTMQNIADEARVGVATLFRYFPKKDLLIIEVVKDAIDQQAPRFEEILKSHKTGIEKIDDVLTTYIGFISEENRESAMLLEAFELYIAFIPIEKELLEEVEAAYRKIGNIISTIFKEGRNDGSIKPTLSHEMLSNTILNMFGTAVKKYSLYTLLPDTIIPSPNKEELIMVKNSLLSYLKNEPL